MLLVAAALACDDAVLAELPVPAQVSAEPAVAHGATREGAIQFAGARVSYASAHSLAEWAAVLTRPEDQDEWSPESLGLVRVERLDPGTIFQQMDISMLLGAVHVRR